MREVRRALLEADVALEVVRDFTEKVKAKAIGQDVVKSVTPGQMVVKIVHDELVAMLGSDAAPIDLAAAAAGRRSCWSACRARARPRPAPRSPIGSPTATRRKC